MVAKSEIKIDVSSQDFDAFAAKFREFQTASADMPDRWKATGDAAEDAGSKFEKMGGLISAASENMTLMLDHSDKLSQATASTAHHWKDLARDTASVAKNIAGATISLLKWAGITSVIGGLVGGGTLFGLDRLGENVSRGRSAAMGAGTTYGGLSAFRINYGRLGDPEGILSRVNEAQSSLNGKVALHALGLSDADINGDSAEAAAKAVEGLQRFVDAGDPRMLKERMEANKITDIFSLEQAVALIGRGAEVKGMSRSFRQDRRSLDVAPKDQLAWQEFATQMERAGAQIGAVFIRGLAPLEPGLERLSKAFADILATLMAKNGPIADWLGKLNDGLERLAKYIDTPEFQQDVGTFVDGIGSMATGAVQLAKTVGTFATRLAGLLGVSPAEASTGGQQGASGGSSTLTAGRGIRLFHGARGDDSEEYGGPAPSGNQQTKAMELMDDLVKLGWTPEAASIAAGNAKVESGLTLNGPAGDHGTSHDLMQWHNERWTAFQQFASAHPDLKGMALRAAFIDHEEPSRAPGWRGVRDLSQAGQISHRYEGYSSATTGARVGAAHSFLDNYRKTHVTVRANTGNTPARSANAVAAPP